MSNTPHLQVKTDTINDICEVSVKPSVTRHRQDVSTTHLAHISPRIKPSLRRMPRDRPNLRVEITTK
jgi:hypothetical protein